MKSLVVFLLLALGAPALFAAEPAASGKRVRYVHNQTKLEKARAAQPATDPKRLAALESWRDSDNREMAWLQSLGFTVIKASEATPLPAAADQDLIIVSESVDAVDVDAKYRYLPVPLITCENDLLGEFGMTGLKNGRDYGTDDDQRFIWLVNAPHPLAGGLGAGLQNVQDDEHCKMSWGKPGLGAVTIATLRGEPDKAAIFCYEQGATMNGEFLAPARRVNFFLWQDGFAHLRPEGLALFKSAVLWAVSPPR